MPGEKCAFPRCSTSRKYKGIILFKVPAPDKTNDERIKWTKNLIDIILKYRSKLCFKMNIPEQGIAVYYCYLQKILVKFV